MVLLGKERTSGIFKCENLTREETICKIKSHYFEVKLML